MNDIERRSDLPLGSHPHNPLPIKDLQAFEEDYSPQDPLLIDNVLFVEMPHTGPGFQTDTISDIKAVNTDPGDFGTVIESRGRYKRDSDGNIDIVRSERVGETNKDIYGYPFASTLRTRIQENPEGYTFYTSEDFNLQEVISKINKPVLEVAGPTKMGYYFLDGINLPSKPYITNVTTSPLGMENYASLIDESADGSRLPFADQSVGIMLLSCINKTVDAEELGVVLPEDLEERVKVKDGLRNQATNEMTQVSEGKLGLDAAKYSLRTRIYAEASRVVEGGGLLIVNRLGNLDVSALEAMGFEIVAKIERNVDNESFVSEGPLIETAVFQRKSE